MHVLIVHQAFASPREPGGTRHYEIGGHLVANGHRVTVLASQASYLTGQPTVDRPGLVAKEHTPAGVAVWRCPTYTALHKTFIHRLLAYAGFTTSAFVAGLLTRDVDLVWGTSPPLFQGLTALALARLKGVPFVFEVRDLWPDFAVGLGVLRQPVVIALTRGLERFLYHAADRIVVNSPGYLAHIRACGVPEDKLSVVPNGVEVGHFSPERRGETLRAAWGLDGKFVVLYAGAHGLANDLGVLLEAAGRLRDLCHIVFVLVGDGKEKASLVQRAQRMALDNVRFLPAQPKDRMPDVLAAADVCVAALQPIPMFATTYPNKVFDYMAAGRPTILVIDGVIRTVIEAADGGTFVPPGDPQALADAVLAYAADRGTARRQGEHARHYVQTHFDRRLQAARMERILLDVARPSTRRGRRRGPRWAQRALKRVFDVVVASVTLCALLPVFVLVAALVRLTSGSPVLFKQVRLGYHGRPFTLYKFRTMTDGRDANGCLLPDEDRLTPLGKLLRATTLDELPELINVLRGDMSVVGPRPLLVDYRDLYTPEQWRRHDMPPGMAGPVVARGRNALSWEDKFALDVWYVDNWSLRLDLQLLAEALVTVLKREGVTAQGHASMPKFQGVRPASPEPQ